MTVDALLVTRKLALIAADMTSIEQLLGRGREAYLSDRVVQAAAERHIQRVIGRMIDVNYHLVTAVGQMPPKDYYASFIALGGIGVVDRDFAARISGAAGLRNRLVHDYDDLDPHRVFNALQAAVVDVPRDVAAVNAHMARSTD
jgi:uncharacterized protein YutE (UPF0331/DUF86 family)